MNARAVIPAQRTHCDVGERDASGFSSKGAELLVLATCRLLVLVELELEHELSGSGEGGGGCAGGGGGGGEGGPSGPYDGSPSWRRNFDASDLFWKHSILANAVVTAAVTAVLVGCGAVAGGMSLS